MSIHPIIGHQEARTRLAQAFSAERLPQLLLLTGPAGVGKQRLGLWLGQLLLCEHPGVEPCGECIPCRQVLALGHPDLHWIIPVERPKSADLDKQVEELAESLAAAVAERRSNALVYRPAAGLEGHFVATARLLQRRAALTPVVGRRKVFLVAEADRLVPQEANPEAANALLKLLEEPPADTQFILTAVDPNALLPTVRSRLVPLRLGRLADADVTRFLEQNLPTLPRAELAERVRLADGSIGLALADADTRARARRGAEEFLQAALSGPAGRLERALRQGPFAARGDFTELLNAVAADLSEAARTAAGAGRGHSVPRALAGKRSPAALVRAVERVSAAREAAQGNVNPQLLLAVLGAELAEIL